MQDDFQHELGAQVGQNEETEAAQRPAHRRMATPAVDVVPPKQYGKHRPGSHPEQDHMGKLQGMTEDFLGKQHAGRHGNGQKHKSHTDNTE